MSASKISKPRRLRPHDDDLRELRSARQAVAGVRLVERKDVASVVEARTVIDEFAVAADWEPDFTTRKMMLVRKSDGFAIDTRPMTPKERNRYLA